MTELVRSEDATAVLVVDDCDEDSAGKLERVAAAAKGRIRLVLISDRQDRRAASAAGDLDVLPLDAPAMAKLVQSLVAVSREDAEQLANLAEGFPKLALVLAGVAEGAAAATVLDLIRTRDVLGLLRRMLPEGDTLKHLAHLAIMERLGFMDELSYETTDFCAAFGLQEASFRADVVQELGRLVARVGRYVRVTPRALAVWLIAEQVRGRPEEYADVVAHLPEPLFDSFRQQMELLSGDPSVDSFIREVVALRGDNFRSIDDLTAEGSRLLLTLAYALPEEAASRIEELMHSASTEALVNLDGSTRRDLVWACQHLLWFEPTFTVAASALWALAVAENEPYANNATGIFVGAFLSALGGTEVPLGNRLAWLRTQSAGRDLPWARIALQAVGASLALHQTRTGGWRGARRQPEEWRPGRDELAQLGKQAIDLMLDLAGEHPELEGDTAKTLASLLLVPRYPGMVDQVVDALGSKSWDPTVLGAVVPQLDLAVKRGQLMDDERSRIQQLHDRLTGGDVETRLRRVLATSLWQLGDDRLDTEPQILPQLAAELLANNNAMEIVISPETIGDSTTIYNVARHVGIRDAQAPVVEDRFLDQDARSEARSGYVAGRGSVDDVWATQIIETWAADSARAPDIGPLIVRLKPSQMRAELLLHSVEEGICARYEPPALSAGPVAQGLSARHGREGGETLDGRGLNGLSQKCVVDPRAVFV